jgi:hypothetical protein
MATFPSKVNYATGDVLTATNMNDVGGALNLLESAQYAAGKNAIINGGFDIAQRGTSINTASATQAYTLDRLWVYSNGPSVTTSQQVTGDTTNLPFIQYCARLQRQSGQTSTSSTVWNMPLETKNSIPFAGKIVTVSYYARKSSTWTSTNFGAQLWSGTGTDQSGLSGYTGQVSVAAATPTLTTTWTRYTMTGTVAATATELRIEFATNNWVGTAGANDYCEITGVQLEAASNASPFQTASGSIGAELALCQRYYYRVTASGSGRRYGTGFATSVNAGSIWIQYPVTMRTQPTALEQTGTATDYSLAVAGANVTCTGVPTHLIASYEGAQVDFPATALLVAGMGAGARANATNAYLGWSAEL